MKKIARFLSGLLIGIAPWAIVYWASTTDLPLVNIFSIIIFIAAMIYGVRIVDTIETASVLKQGMLFGAALPFMFILIAVAFFFTGFLGYLSATAGILILAVLIIKLVKTPA